MKGELHRLMQGSMQPEKTLLLLETVDALVQDEVAPLSCPTEISSRTDSYIPLMKSAVVIVQSSSLGQGANVALNGTTGIIGSALSSYYK